MMNLQLAVIAFLSIHIIAMSHPKLAIATRLHLGHASHPPPTQQLTETLSNFAKLALDTGANIAVVAVDAEDKLEGYSLVSEVEVICRRLNLVQEQNKCMIDILPVQPWGKFIPALNAIISYSARLNAECLLFASAEVGIRGDVMERLWKNMDLDDTLVVGSVLQGHQYSEPKRQTTSIEVELTGRTCPWNTFALWNLPKLSLTGFLQVSEGLHREEGIGGIEEVCTIATLQKVLSHNTCKAKLVKIDSPAMVEWGQDFKEDEGRREWHERKMQSKDSRARKQLDLMGLSGVGLVMHC